MAHRLNTKLRRLHIINLDHHVLYILYFRSESFTLMFSVMDMNILDIYNASKSRKEGVFEGFYHIRARKELIEGLMINWRSDDL